MNQEIGFLYNKQNLELQRAYFKQMLHMIGIKVFHYAPLPGKRYTNYGEIKTCFEEPVLTGCIFDDHPTQKTMKKLGWDSERQEEVSLISVPYDLAHVQAGSLFALPSGIDNAEARLFRVVEMSTIMLYPASITCRLVPEWKNTTHESQIIDFKTQDFNLLREEE